MTDKAPPPEFAIGQHVTFKESTGRAHHLVITEVHIDTHGAISYTALPAKEGL